MKTQFFCRLIYDHVILYLLLFINSVDYRKCVCTKYDLFLIISRAKQ